MSATDEKPPALSLEQQLAAMSPEQRAAAEAQAIEQMMTQVIPLPMAWNIAALNGPDGPMVLLDFKTPTGQLRTAVSRDAALQIASEIRKQAQTGPKLQIAQPGQVPGL